MTLKIGIAGCLGRMGQMLLRRAAALEGVQLVSGSVKPEEMAEAKQVLTQAGLGHLELSFHDDAASFITSADAVVDFSTPEYSLALAKEAAAQGKIYVCGTTGFSEAQKDELRGYGAAGAKILWAPNMSVGVNLVAALTEQVAARLPALQYDIEVLEMHHRHKVDAPSGTALLFGEAAAKGRDVNLAEVKDAVRDGHTGARTAGDIGFATLRGGDVVGDHTVIFASDGDRIELTHKASSRAIFADGALQAALWLNGQNAGYYSIQDMLGL